MPYVDGFLVPVPKKNVQAYKRLSTKAGKIWKELGALEYRECVADDLSVFDGQGDKVSPFPKLTKLKPSETLFFSYIVYKSRAHRDQVNKKVMSDPRLAKMMDPKKKQPFDVKRMAYGGFKTLVDL
jgi:uncharacterized protein YbaA (DUF1428 family)